MRKTSAYMGWVGLAFAAILLLSGCAQEIHLRGVTLHGTNAPEFTLSDSSGKPVAFSSFRGRVVVLTFLYSTCDDVCPIIAARLARVSEQLGAAANDLAIVAVSVAPELDTPVSIQAFLQRYGLEGKLTYLTGSRAQLDPVWKLYHVTIDTPAPMDTRIVHQSRLVLIDRGGEQRAYYDPSFAVDDLVSDLHTILSASSTQAAR